MFKKLTNKFKSEETLRKEYLADLIKRAKSAHLAINDIKFNEKELCYINPHEQDALNFGWYSPEDIEDFLNFKGKIFKGKTNEDKEKFIQYYKFIKDYPKFGWRCNWYYQKHFHLINENYDPYERNYKFGCVLEKPMKIKKGDNNEIISNMFGFLCKNFSEDLKHCYSENSYDDFNRRYNNESYGVKITLANLGIGYFSYSNSPEDIQNLSWISDIAFHKAHYLTLKNKGVVFPDFEFVHNNRYKM